MKVLLILVDGMRPDALDNIAQAQAMKQKSTYCMQTRTVFPSVTLPCHVSLFHSVDPDRHGTTTNTYTPQVRPISGLCEQIKLMNKSNAFFYNWEQLRDIARPSSLDFSYYIGMRKPVSMQQANQMVADAAIHYIGTCAPDFAFLYLGRLDEEGHDHGWMGDAYMQALQDSWAEIDRVLAQLPEEYAVIITADHGGHDRTHGTLMPEDMTTPLFLLGKPFAPGKELAQASIKDIAPTVAALLGVPAAPEWEGSSLA